MNPGPAKRPEPHTPTKKSTAEPTPEPHSELTQRAETIEPLAAPGVAPTIPPGFAAGRVLTVTEYRAAGKPSIWYLAEGSYNAFHSGAENVSADVKNRLSPPPATTGAG